jgi:hypothetical protein
MPASQEALLVCEAFCQGRLLDEPGVVRRTGAEYPAVQRPANQEETS